jgi:hypothetical protein
MVTRTFLNTTNYKFNAFQTNTEFDQMLLLPISELLSTPYQAALSQIEKEQSSIEKLTTNLQALRAEAADLEGRIKAMNEDDVEGLALMNARKERLSHLISQALLRLSEVEIALYKFTTQELIVAMGIAPSVRSEETLKKQIDEVKNGYLGFYSECGLILINSLFLVSEFKQESILPLLFSLMAHTLLTFRVGNINGQLKEIEESIARGYEILNNPDLPPPAENKFKALMISYQNCQETYNIDLAKMEAIYSDLQQNPSTEKQLEHDNLVEQLEKTESFINYFQDLLTYMVAKERNNNL